MSSFSRRNAWCLVNCNTDALPLPIRLCNTLSNSFTADFSNTFPLGCGWLMVAAIPFRKRVSFPKSIPGNFSSRIVYDLPFKGSPIRTETTGSCKSFFLLLALLYNQHPGKQQQMLMKGCRTHAQWCCLPLLTFVDIQCTWCCAWLSSIPVWLKYIPPRSNQTQEKHKQNHKAFVDLHHWVASWFVGCKYLQARGVWGHAPPGKILN